LFGDGRKRFQGFPLVSEESFGFFDDVLLSILDVLNEIILKMSDCFGLFYPRKDLPRF